MIGITLMLIAVAGINQPEHMFDTALARICEISVDIACCSLVDSLISPQSLHNVWRRRLDVWLPHMQTWLETTFQGHIRHKQPKHERLQLIHNTTDMTPHSHQPHT